VLRQLVQELYGSVPASFPAVGSVEQATRALSAVTPRLGFTFRRSGVVAGRVSGRRVVLRRARPSANPFAPEFRGRFNVESGRAVLSGNFALNPFVRAFMTVWFAFFGFAALAGLAVGAALSAQRWLGIVAGAAYAFAAVAFAYLGLVIVRLSKRLVRDDPEFISNHIREAFEDAAA
jgi:hypothetical protein